VLELDEAEAWRLAIELWADDAEAPWKKLEPRLVDAYGCREVGLQTKKAEPWRPLGIVP
jgi:hypothetical protein